MSRSVYTWAVGAVLFGFALSSGGCDDDGNGTQDSTSPRFAVATRLLVAGATDLQIFVGFTDDVESGELDLSNSIDIGGSGGLWGVDGSGEFYITRGEDLTLNKYRFEDGQPVFVDRTSFAQEIPFLAGEFMAFDGPDRAYLLQVTTGQGFALDLEAMEIVDRVDLTTLVDAEQPTFMNSIDVFRDGEVVGATYATDAVQETVSEVSQIVFFDPTDGSFEARPAPCGGLTYNMTAPNGDIYFAADPWVAGIHAIDPSRGPAPCLVRLPAGSREPDPSPIMLNDITGGPTGGLIPFGDSSILVRVLDTEQFPVTEETTNFQLFGSPAWDTWEIDLLAPERSRRIERDPLAGAILYFVIDGEVYDNETSADFSSTTLVRTTGPDAPAPGLQISGIPLSVVQLR